MNNNDEYDYYDILPGDDDLFRNTVIPTGDFSESDSKAYARPVFIDLRSKYDRTFWEKLTWKFLCDYNGLPVIRKYLPWRRDAGRKPEIIEHPKMKKRNK